MFLIFVSALIAVRASQNKILLYDSPFKGVPTIIPSAGPDQTVKWNVASDFRSEVEFTIKYPPGWDENSDYCIKPPNPNNYELSANCLRLVIMTDKLLSDDGSSMGRDLFLTSQTQTVIDGYRAIRKIYSLGDNPKEDVADTYHLWIYNNERPIMLVIGWIGVDTDGKTAAKFIRTLDQMVGTLKIKKPSYAQ